MYDLLCSCAEHTVSKIIRAARQYVLLQIKKYLNLLCFWNPRKTSMSKIQNGCPRACVCACECVDQWRPPTWASRFLHSWVCCWCCCRAALACLSRLLTSRWCSWTRLSFSALCCCCSRVLSCSCCIRCSAIWLDKQAKRDFISQHTLRATLSSWQLVHPPIHPSFLRPIPSNPLPAPKNPRACAKPNLAKLVGKCGEGGKKREKFCRFLTSSEDDMMWCVYIWLAPPALPPLLPIVQTGPPRPTPLSSNLSPSPYSGIGI